MRFDSHFANSEVVKTMFRVKDMVELGKTENSDNSRKRSRNDYEDASANLYKEILRQLDYADVLPTFRSLVMYEFYILLANNPHNEYYEQVCQVVVKFRSIIMDADNLIFKGRYEAMFNLMTNDLYKLLLHSQQLITLFHLTCSSPTR
jgi:hypothetical protein